MKELSIEEKAKCYDEALEKARQLCAYPTTKPFIRDLQDLFPELAESEDDRIKKAIKYGLDYVFTNNTTVYETTKEQCLAWLEKQDETFTKKDVDDAYLKGVTDTKNEIEKQYEETYQIRKDIATFIFNYKGDIKDRAKWIDYLGIKFSLVKKQGEQKPAWSEEDEKMLNDILMCGEHHCYLDAGNITWLKSIKDKVQPQQKQEWSEEDEKLFNRICDLIHEAAFASCETDENGKELGEYAKMMRLLKSLKDRVQPKQEWSEEDELSLKQAIYVCHQNGYTAVENWLKSLRPKNTWKPSDGRYIG